MTIYCAELAAKICARIAEGESVTRICKDKGMPAMVTFYTWIQKHPEFLTMYQLAKEQQADTFADQMVDIADESTDDISYDDKGKKIVNHENINRSRLRVDTRKWIAARMKPKVYGDKVTTSLTGHDGGQLSISTITRTIVDPAKPE